MTPQTPQDRRHATPATPDDPAGGESPYKALEAAQAHAERAAWHAGRLGIRCTEEWATWVGGLSVWADLPASELVNQALYRFAESLAYAPRQPSRLDRFRAALRSPKQNRGTARG